MTLRHLVLYALQHLIIKLRVFFILRIRIFYTQAVPRSVCDPDEGYIETLVSAARYGAAADVLCKQFDTQIILYHIII